MVRKVIESHGPRVPLCCDCRHAGEDGYCSKMAVSQSFARQSRERIACGPWGNMFERSAVSEMDEVIAYNRATIDFYQT